MVVIERLEQIKLDAPFAVIVIHANFLPDNPLLFLNRFLCKIWPAYKIKQDFERLLKPIRTGEQIRRFVKRRVCIR